jgi:hypothetical protein
VRNLQDSLELAVAFPVQFTVVNCRFLITQSLLWQTQSLDSHDIFAVWLCLVVKVSPGQEMSELKICMLLIPEHTKRVKQRLDIGG